MAPRRKMGGMKSVTTLRSILGIGLCRVWLQRYRFAEGEIQLQSAALMHWTSPSRKLLGWHSWATWSKQAADALSAAVPPIVAGISKSNLQSSRSFDRCMFWIAAATDTTVPGWRPECRSYRPRSNLVGQHRTATSSTSTAGATTRAREATDHVTATGAMSP